MPGKKRNNKSRKPSKPIAGGIRIQQLCPVPDSRHAWRVLLVEIVELEDGEAAIATADNGDPRYMLVDVACWALLVEETEQARYQDIWACIATDDGVIEPVSPGDDNFLGLVPPSYGKKDIIQMVIDGVDALDLPMVNGMDEEDEDDEDEKEES